MAMTSKVMAIVINQSSMARFASSTLPQCSYNTLITFKGDEKAI